MPPKNPWVLPDGFDDNVKKAVAEIRAAFANAKKSIPKEALQALQQGNYEAFLAMIDWTGINTGFAGLQGILQGAATGAAVSQYRKAGVGAKLTFDIIDEYSVNWASTQTGYLIKGITEEMRLNIQRTITEATMGDLTWQQAAEQIGEYIPLTERDAKAVAKYHDRMMKKYIDRKGWKEKEARKYAKSLTEAYAEKLTKSRASTIARTEIANAATQGQYIGWEAGMQSGMLDSQSQKEWIAEPSACEYCHAMDGKLVPWDAEFPIFDGKLMPPAHPNCRCAAAMVPPEYADSEFTAQALQKSKGWWNQFEIEFAKHLAGLHDQSTHGHGHGSHTHMPDSGEHKQSLHIPEHSDVSKDNLVAASFPYVGLSEKAQSVAAAIKDVKTATNNPASRFINIDGSPETIHTATYTDRDGTEHYMKIFEAPSADKTGVSGAVITFSNREDLEAASLASASEIVYQKGFEGYLQYGANFRNPISIGNLNASKIYKAQSKGKGVATAMLEFGRSTSPMPILHSNHLTEDGAGFAATTKGIAKHLMGQHDQSTHGHGHGEVGRPYELNSKRGDRNYNTTGVAYSANALEGRGPSDSILGNSISWSSTNPEAYERWGSSLKARAEGHLAVVASEDAGSDPNFLYKINNDPDYPMPPKHVLEAGLAAARWNDDGSITLANLPDTRKYELQNDSIKLWAKSDPDAAAAYLAKENKFVEDRVREIKFANGQTVGEVIDGMSQSLIDQMREIAIGNSVSLTMPTSKLKRFIDEDHYRTAYETKLSGKGANRQYYMERREEFENNLMGIPWQTEHSKRPIYGVIGKQGATYGDAQVIFKDEVKHRTTATIGDSLDGHAQGAIWLEDYASGKVTVDDLWEVHGGLFLDTFGNNLRSGSTFMWEMESATDAKWGKIKGFSGKSDLHQIGTYHYVETQIHGGLKLSDVATIVIPSPTSLTKATQAMLTDKGIEVIVGSHIEKSLYA
jgi:SPP1 gp7 family putative phage head morphogenesis protein